MGLMPDDNDDPEAFLLIVFRVERLKSQILILCDNRMDLGGNLAELFELLFVGHLDAPITQKKRNHRGCYTLYGFRSKGFAPRKLLGRNEINRETPGVARNPPGFAGFARSSKGLSHGLRTDPSALRSFLHKLASLHVWLLH